MWRRFDRSPLYVLDFLLLLALPQCAALVAQFSGGFVPFVHDPARVTLSWDMFATRVERCLMSWSPPIAFEGRSLSNLHDALLPLEWDVVFDHVSDYRFAGRRLCDSGAQGPTKIGLHCFLPDGREVNDDFACR